MIARLAAALAVALAIAVAAGAFYRSRALALQVKVEQAEARAEGAERAVSALDAHVDAVTAERDRWRAIAEELETVEGADEPLNAYERAVLDRVRR